MTADTWYIVQCESNLEGRCVGLLAWLGYPGGWYPYEEREVPSRLRSAARKRYHRYAIVPGYVFFPANHVRVHRINDLDRRPAMRVLCPGGEPYKVKAEDMARMKQVPDQVRDLVENMERLLREEMEAKMPKVGETAHVSKGVFEGWRGIVQAVEGDIVSVDIGGMFGPVKLPVREVERVA